MCYNYPGLPRTLRGLLLPIQRRAPAYLLALGRQGYSFKKALWALDKDPLVPLPDCPRRREH